MYRHIVHLPARLRPYPAREHWLLSKFDYAATAQQEDEEDMDAAEEVGPEEMAVGTLLITHLTNQDLRSMEVLLPREAVEANIPSATMHPLIKFEV